MSPVFVGSVGIVSSIGMDVASVLHALKTEQSRIGFPKILKTHWAKDFPVGEIPFENTELAQLSGHPQIWPRTALLSTLAVRQAWSLFEGQDRFPVSFISANTVGGMDLSETFYPKYLKDADAGELLEFGHHACGAPTSLVAGMFGFDGTVSTVSTACSSSANSLMMAAQMIRAGWSDVVVAGGSDALCRFTLNGFNTLGILDREPCQPFDADRRGLNLGEGAAYLVLMSEKAIRHFQVEPLACLTGWGNANDAFHQTASSAEGTGNALAMQSALKRSGLNAPDISYVNLHGTGTANNDSSEGIAVEKVFLGNVPPASSTKAYTGHTLGAAGAVEAVFSVLAIQHGLVFPNLRWRNQMEETAFTPQLKLQESAVRNVLSNSFGFGGACTSLIFSAC